MSTVRAIRTSRMSPAERQVRLDLAACYRLVALYGWSDMLNTHISARVPGPHDHFLINPYGMLFDEITASSLVKIDLDGNKVEPSDWPVNPAGFVIHSAIHMARHDLVCVLHTRTVAGCAVSMQKHGLLPLNQHALQVIGDVAYHAYEGPATRLDERERLVADLGERRILVLRNHGLLTVGRSVAEAFVATYRIERACQMQIAFQQTGAELEPVPQEIIGDAYARARERFAGGGRNDPAGFEWPALLRKLDRIDPSYKE